MTPVLKGFPPPDNPTQCINFIYRGRAGSYRCIRKRKEGSELCGICFAAITRAQNRDAAKERVAAGHKATSDSLKKQSQSVIDTLATLNIEATASYRIHQKDFTTHYDGGITLSAEDAQKLRHLLQAADSAKVGEDDYLTMRD